MKETYYSYCTKIPPDFDTSNIREIFTQESNQSCHNSLLFPVPKPCLLRGIGHSGDKNGLSSPLPGFQYNKVHDFPYTSYMRYSPYTGFMAYMQT